ncbi:MAG: hypothetical protein Q9177_002850 [Variospora cf. flavescens]
MSREQMGGTTDPRPSFLSLPLEIRQQIYRILLPSQDVPVRSHQWSNLIESPDDYLQLTIVNRQISDEAREILYSSTASTVVLSDQTTKFLGYRDHSMCQSLLLYHIPRMRPVHYMKHWQLSILFKDYGSEYREPDIGEALDLVSAELAKVPDLQTLKISLPCLCNEKAMGSKDLQVAAWEHVRRSIEPLWPLRFNCQVRFITAQRWRPWENAVKEYETANPAPSILNRAAWHKWRLGRPEWWYPKDSERVDNAIKSAANKQCQEAACLDFAASFHDIKADIEGTSSAPDPLSSRRKIWLALRDYAVTWIPYHDPYVYVNALNPTWKALASASEKDFDTIARMAQQILRARWRYLHSSGKLERFFTFPAEYISSSSVWAQRLKGLKVDVDNQQHVCSDWLRMEKLTLKLRRMVRAIRRPTGNDLEVLEETWGTTMNDLEVAEETAETDTSVEDTTDYAATEEADSEESDSEDVEEEQWPPEDWWLQKTMTRTASVGTDQVAAAQAEGGEAAAAKTHQAPLAFSD